MIVDNTETIKKLKEMKKSLSQIKKNALIFEPFWEDFKLRFCWSSNAMEGNTLNLDETVDIILYDEVKSGHTYKEYTEAKNLYQSSTEQIVSDKITITEDWLKKCNALIMGNDGEYRTGDVYIGTLTEAIHYPTSFEKVQEEMDKLIKEINIETDSIEEVINKIAEFHIKFEHVHPFQDGNGRTGRMIINQQLINNDLLPIAIDKTSKYRQAFRAYDRNLDISILVHLICSAEMEAIERVNKLEQKQSSKNSN